MSVKTETFTNGHHNGHEYQHESENENMDIVLPRFSCKKCLDEGVHPIQSIYFNELRELFKHYDTHDDPDEQPTTEQTTEEENEFEELWLDFKNKINNLNTKRATNPSIHLNNAPVAASASFISHFNNSDNKATPSIHQSIKAQKRKSISSSLFNSETKKKVNFHSNLESISQESDETETEDNASDATFNDQDDSDDNDQESILNESATQPKPDSVNTKIWLNKINNYNESELKYFNLTMTGLPQYKFEITESINEQELSDKITAIYAGKELKKGKILFFFAFIRNIN